MAEIKDLNTTDASNSGTAANAGFPENMAYSDVNNAARALEGMIARWYADTNSTLDTAGSSNAYTLTPNRTVAAYARGDTYTVEASFTNTGAATINVSSLGAKSIVKPSGSAVASGDIQSGGIYTLVYDGTNFQMAGVDDPTTLSITTLTVSGVTTLNGNTVIGSDASDTVTINADVASNVLPSADNTYDLGASGSEWKDLYIDGIAYVDTLNADSVDIDGGSIDGTTIGGSSAAAGTFTTISGTTITASTSLKTPLIEYTDGDDAITIADGGGVTIADLTATSIDVNGGTIDGAVIGGSSAAAGSFTTLSASTSITGTLATAAQTNITSVGTLTGFTSTGIDDNASSNAITIDSSQNTTFAGQVSIDGGSPIMVLNRTASTGDQEIQFHDVDVHNSSVIGKDGGGLAFGTNGNTVAMTLDSSQRVGIGAAPAYGKLDIRQTGTGAQDRGLYVDVTPASAGSNNNAALVSVGNANMTGTVFRIHHESPAADQKLLSLDTTGSNTEKFWVDEDGDALLAGGLFLGGSADANKISDYEEGSWTVGLATGSATIMSPYYTKIGRFVHFTFQVHEFSDRTTNSSITFTGLPFPVLSSQAAGSAFGIYTSDPTANVVYTNTTEQVNFYKMSSASWETMAHDELSSTLSYFYVSGVYITG